MNGFTNEQTFRAVLNVQNNRRLHDIFLGVPFIRFLEFLRMHEIYSDVLENIGDLEKVNWVEIADHIGRVEG